MIYLCLEMICEMIFCFTERKNLYDMKFILFLISLILLFSGCQSVPKTVSKTEGWHNIAVTEDVEIFTDTTSIRQEGAVAYAREKRIYVTVDGRKSYVDKIRNEYAKMGKAEKADKWSDFSYCIYNSLYDCTNKRFRVLSVEDYDSAGKLIMKTTSSKKNIRWLNVDSETVGDYTFFFVCDYQN
jgi:hypothetical protein